MAHDPAWHAEYRRLETAEAKAREAFRVALAAMSRKCPATGAGEAYEVALEALRAAGKARWDFEMAATHIVDIATLPPRQFIAALRPNSR